MRSLTIAAIAAAGVSWACADAPSPTATTRDIPVDYSRAAGNACTNQTAKTIASQQANLYTKPTLDSAQARFQPVLDNCSSNLDSARSAMLSYVQWTIDTKDSIQQPKSGTPESALLTHWNTVFSYVGYTGTDAPATVPTSIFTDSGTVKLIRNPAAGDSVEIFPATHLAALTMYHQVAVTGDPRPHLFVIYPIAGNCLTGANLTQFGPCYEFGAYPHVAPAFDAPVKVGVCQLLASTDVLPGHRPALGHYNGSFVEIPGQRAYPTFCAHTDGLADAGSWSGGISGIAKRLAYLAHKNFGVETAYAVHGGLGGTGTGLSPFGGVDLEVFNADFENDSVGTVPSVPEVGTWGPITVTAPGTVTVQSSLGASTTGHIVVLNQAGGACKNCGGLLLQGNLLVAPGEPAAHNGTYEATFIALQDNANMKSASFKLRDSGNNVLAQVTFAVVGNTNKVLFNGSDTGVRWVRHIPLSFRVDVNLDTHQASYWITDASNAQLASGSGAFLNSTTNFTNISADFGGIDSGVMGWDQILVVRLQGS